VGIKDQAFRELYGEYPDQLDAIMEYHLSHNHTIRFEKFEYIHNIILGLEYTPQVREYLSARFSEMVFQGIVECPWVAGALEFLEYFKAQDTPLYLVSMSPAEELGRVLEARGIHAFFKDVYASPWKKNEAIADILRREDADASRAVYIGDTPEDSVAAADAGVHFVGRYSGKKLSSPSCKDMHAVRKQLT